MGYLNSQYRSVAPAQIEKRGVLRHPVALRRASIGRRAAKSHDAEIIDVSIYGCRIKTGARFKPDDRIGIAFEGHASISATAVWCKDGKIGCRFDNPLDRSLFRTLTLVID